MIQYDGLNNIQIDQRAMTQLLDSPTGAVGRHMRKIMIEIFVGAKAMVGVRTGALRRSIYYRHSTRARVQFIEVGAKDPKAYMHHEGTRPHQIRATPGRIMRFNVGGRVIYAQKVNHPGTKPNNYLTVPMRRAVRR